MKRKFLEDLGIEKEIIDKIMTENGTDINTAKADYEDIKNQLDASAKQIIEREEQIAERDKQLEGLKNCDSESLTEQIATLQKENKAAKEKYDADMKDLKITSAIKLAVAEKTYDADMVAGLIDKSKIIVEDNGEITGLEEQMKPLKEGKPFLFKAETVGAKGGTGKVPYTPHNGATNEASLAKTIAESMNKESTGNPYEKAWG